MVSIRDISHLIPHNRKESLAKRGDRCCSEVERLVKKIKKIIISFFIF